MRPRILFVTNDCWFFASHRLPIATALIKEGYEVHLSARADESVPLIESTGCIVHPWQLEPRGRSIVVELRAVLKLWRIFRKVRPDITHLITIKAVIYGGLISRFLGVKAVLYAISGIGAIYVSTGLRARTLRWLLKPVHRLSLGHQNSVIIFQNKSDMDTITGQLNIGRSRTALIHGSGVDLNRFRYTPEDNESPITILMATRLLRDKGIFEFIEACDLITDRSSTDVQCLLLGGNLAQGNPAALTDDEIKFLREHPNVSFLGQRDDVAELMSQANIAILPSYREGLPKVLCEAAACGRAVITTDVPGCRDAIQSDKTGLLVPVKDSLALTDACLELISNHKLRNSMGRAGRELALTRFGIETIVEAHLNLYKSLLKRFSPRCND